MKLAAIDIGSNAIRLQITNVIESQGESYFKKLQYVRFPLRLGADVFEIGKMSDQTRKKFLQLMEAFKILIDLYEVSDFKACATSAMREAENGAEVIAEVEQKIGLKIEVIPGEQEAAMIKDAIQDYLIDDEYIHIDVGGGSTEINIFEYGKKQSSASFKIGSVRRLQHHDAPVSWQEMEDWVKENARGKDDLVSVGTGGNIGKYQELLQIKPGKSITLAKIEELRDYIASLSLEERQITMKMNPDRADVIIPASDIYISVMKWAKSNRIIVPDVGLKDGVLKELYFRQIEARKTINIIK